MSLEQLSALASLGTFVVIAATAIAALVQLRHLRSNNQIATMARLETLNASDEVAASKLFVFTELAERMKDSEFRKLLTGRVMQGEARRILPVINFYEQMGNYVKHGFIDRDVVLDTYGSPVLGAWGSVVAVVPFLRRAQGEDQLIGFEYMASLAKAYLDERRGADYPRGAARLPLDTTWFDIDDKSRQ